MRLLLSAALLVLAACTTEAEPTVTPILTDLEAANVAYTFAASRYVPTGRVELELSLAAWCFSEAPRGPKNPELRGRLLPKGWTPTFEPATYQAALRNGKWVVSSDKGCTFIVDDATGLVAWPAEVTAPSI